MNTKKMKFIKMLLSIKSIVNKILLVIIPLNICVTMYAITLFCGNNWEGFLLASSLTLIPFISGIYFMQILKQKNKKVDDIK